MLDGILKHPRRRDYPDRTLELRAQDGRLPEGRTPPSDNEPPKSAEVEGRQPHNFRMLQRLGFGDLSGRRHARPARRDERRDLGSH
jgi:hypothetical protein